MFSELRSDLVPVYELKKVHGNCEYEHQMLRHGYEALLKTGGASGPPGEVPGAEGQPAPGFFESFVVNRSCRYCMATRSEIQDKEVSSDTFEPRTIDTHNRQVQEVYMEFNRIAGKNLEQEFYEGIDRHSPRLMEIFRSKRGNVGKQLTELTQQTRDSDDDDSFRHIEVGILLVEREGAALSSLHLSPASVKIIIEGAVMMDNIEDLPKAMCLLFGLSSALHLNYPKSMKLTFQFIQQMSDNEKVDSGQEEPTDPQTGISNPGEEQKRVPDDENTETERKEENEPTSYQPTSEDTDPPVINIQKTETGVRGHRRIGANKPRSTGHTVASAISCPSTATVASGKRTAVLSNEARREMAKQAKAAKDERRAMLDARHKYLITKLVDVVSLAEAEVEEVIVSDDKFNLIEEFFAPNGSKRLLFFYQEVKSRHSTHLSWSDTASSALGQKKLFVTTGSAEEVNFGMLDCSRGNILQSLEKLFSQVMLPALKSQENWGAVKDGQDSVQIQEFLRSVDTFVCSLSSARQNMEGKFQLQPMEAGHNLDHLLGPSDYTTAGTAEFHTKIFYKLFPYLSL
ncbi:hypothetical protein AAFF_G00184600 [Aldrovandia affinis]|uniref:DNA methyltransferase 1-associated 1 domain-containing protein n=1 Tax=Aldrovandia affinis TaxID=143900 RepID=A0AAD7RJQ3_9TELE|nr:hypothetical protein AAFF_G00184600 [Aldrovandia affinis]